jgi:GAF domain-containing protein
MRDAHRSLEKFEALVADIARSPWNLADKAHALAKAIREFAGYRWVGIYTVSEAEISVLGWDGPGAPAYPRFPSDRGLCGAAVASATTVIVDDVAADARYLTTFGTTRSEMVVPVVEGDRVVGLIDVESDALGAFGPSDQLAVERAAHEAAQLWRV